MNVCKEAVCLARLNSIQSGLRLLRQYAAGREHLETADLFRWLDVIQHDADDAVENEIGGSTEVSPC